MGGGGGGAGVPFVSSTVVTYGERGVLYAQMIHLVSTCVSVFTYTPLFCSQNDMLLLTWSTCVTVTGDYHCD